ncbi:hypothetical protein H257_08229 [Aphanomyces astaci]|uniref:Uncharacterized protein n=1 Tax=Aphanomyces astaci TaxID=112090 RepID=W4GEA1_APHAT|nr:hypothetical protein H257_08229 [Aphanomyces astaci]ETV78012.1 hypothetical protein H257_08229 [Aphanomyces astaci]|eukprot:XP_009832349.1 hypothetical protein H257_08229 [Aphanomyces astaci]
MGTAATIARFLYGSMSGTSLSTLSSSCATTGTRHVLMSSTYYMHRLIERCRKEPTHERRCLVQPSTTLPPATLYTIVTNVTNVTTKMMSVVYRMHTRQ